MISDRALSLRSSGQLMHQDDRDLQEDEEASGAMGDAPEDDDRIKRLEKLGLLIAKMRDAAVQARRVSGIEDIWIAAEEANAGIDDVNRHEAGGRRWMKSSVLDSGLRARTAPDDGAMPRPTAFFRLTSRYVDAAAAKIGEITLPVDGKGFSLKADPVPQAKKLKQDTSQYVHDGQPQFRAALPDEMPPPDPTQPQAPQPQPAGPGQPAPTMPGQAPAPAVPLTVKDLAEHALARAEESAQMAEQRIHGWLTNCQHPRQMRKVLYDGALYGTGCLKGPVPDVERANVLSKSAMGVALEIAYSTVPVTRHVPVWNLYPDPACGEDIHDGDHIFEVDHLSHGRLERLKETGFYLNSQIDAVLKQGPGKVYEANANRQSKTTNDDDTRYEIWYFYGQIKLADFDLINPDDAAALVDEGHASDSVYAIVTMVNDTIIRGTLNPLEKSGEFPYHVFTWRPRPRYWAGIGIAEQVETPQKLVNAAARAAITNAAISAGPMIVFNDDILRPMDGRPGIRPYKLFGLQPDQSMEDVRKAFATFTIPNTTKDLLGLVEFAMRQAEEATNIPLVTQGQSGDTTPDTFGGQQLQDNNATQLLRDVGYAVADGITNPLVRQMNEWLLLDPKVPDEEKMNHQVDANGAIALIEKALQDRATMVLMPLAQDPGFGIDKYEFGKAAIRGLRLNPRDWQVTEEEMTKRLNTQPPPPPQIAAAQIRAASAEKIAQSRDQLASERNAADIDRDTAYNQSLAARDQANAQIRIEELKLKVRLAELEHATQERITLQQSKVDLATETMRLTTQKELAGVKAKEADQVAPTTMEPAGQAPDGEAFQR